MRLLTDATGAVTDTYTYDAFGNLIAQTGTTPNEYLYAGERLDASVGFYYLRARYMNPQSGRFWTMDDYEGSTADPLTLHKYLYAGDDPANKVDPSGHFFGIADQLNTFAARATIAAMNFSVRFTTTIRVVRIGLQLANLAGLVLSEEYRGNALAGGPEAANIVFDDLFEVVGSARATISTYSELLHLRRGYEVEVTGLTSFASMLVAAGKTTREVAIEMVMARRIIGMRYKDASPENIRAAISARNMADCGDPLGRTYEYLRNVKGYSDERIIQSAARPDGGDFWWIKLARKIGLL